MMHLCRALAVLPLLLGLAGAQESVEEHIARGRALLDAERPAEAEHHFLEARRREESVRTQLWVVRSWMDQDRSNDALDAIDELRRSGESGPELDYLYGMAFWRRARKHIADGVQDGVIRLNFDDARTHLLRATEAAPRRFRDAHLPLAESAWYMQDLALARRAGETAIGYGEGDPRAWHQVGKIAFSQFVDAHTAEPWSETATAHWEFAHRAFQEAIAAFGRPVDHPRNQRRLADAALQLGHTRAWREEWSPAADAYAIAIAWAPEGQDYRWLHDRFVRMPEEGSEETAPDVSLFARLLEEGARRFVESFGTNDERDAPLLWWLGWARFQEKRHAQAEEAFTACIRKVPDFVNTWLWIARARFAQENRDGAVAALLEGWRQDPNVLIEAVRADLSESVWVTETLIADLRGQERLEDAAVLSELCAEAHGSDARLWNNLGLVLRELADERKRRHEEDGAPAPDATAQSELHERSLRAYERALVLTPEDPQLLNDAAVLLHYYVRRDLERARTMYTQARAGALAKLDEPSLEETERGFWEAVAEDARLNLEALDAGSTSDPAPERDLDSDPPR